jgi:hypothetical protein
MFHEFMNYSFLSSTLTEMPIPKILKSGMENYTILTRRVTWLGRSPAQIALPQH